MKTTNYAQNEEALPTCLPSLLKGMASMSKIQPEDSPFTGNYGDKFESRNKQGIQNKLEWIYDQAKSYAEILDVPWQAVVDSWEDLRSYSFMNYYQETNQPRLSKENCYIFNTTEDFKEAVGKEGFKCPRCGHKSDDPYTCDSGEYMDNEKKEICDWKSFGLFGTMSKGAYVYVIDKMMGNEIFMPIAWEKGEDKSL